MSVELSVNHSHGLNGSSLTTTSEDLINDDKIRFHARCGSLVKLSSNCRTAERR